MSFIFQKLRQTLWGKDCYEVEKLKAEFERIKMLPENQRKEATDKALASTLGLLDADSFIQAHQSGNGPLIDCIRAASVAGLRTKLFEDDKAAVVCSWNGVAMRAA